MPTPRARRYTQSRNRFIESLESRRLFAAAVWSGIGGDGNWSNAANWDGNAIPVVDQPVTFPFLQSGQVNINLSSNIPVGDFVLDGNYRFITLSPKFDGDLTVTANSTNSQFAVPELGHDLSITVATGGEVRLTSAFDNGHNFGITKNGNGHFLLTGGLTAYAGATRINAGTLELDTIIPSLNLQPGTTLTGNGNPGVLTADHATVSLSQQTDVQSFNITDTFTLGSGSVLRATIVNSGPFGPDYGSLFVSGSGVVDISGATLDVAILTNGYTPPLGDSFPIIRASNGQPVVGNFANLPEGAIATISGNAYQISYVGGSGQDVTLTVVNPPVPTTPTIASVMPYTTMSANSQLLSILGADSNIAGEEGLTYAWTVVRTPAGAGSVVISDDNSHSAQGATATFRKAGLYRLRCTITNIDNNSATSLISIRVNPTATTLRVSPHAQTIARGSSMQYTATIIDQFRKPMQPTSPGQYAILQGEGAIDEQGLFTAGHHRGHVQLEMSAEGLTGQVGATIR